MKEIKIYLAAASDDLERARRWRDRLLLAGFVVVSTWIDNVEKVGAGNPRDASDDDRRSWSFTDLAEVAAANVVWFLIPQSTPGRGGYYETGFVTGMAAALGEIPAIDPLGVVSPSRIPTRRQLLLASGDSKQSIFNAIGYEFADDVDAFVFLVRKMRDEVDVHLATAAALRSSYQ